MTQTKKASANIEDIYPLSPMQEGLLFHTLLEPGSGMYVMQDRYGWDGPLELEAFRAAWQQVMDRHGVLRTSFVWEQQKRPLQVVHKQVAVPLEYLDWRDRSAAAQEQALDAVLAQELATGVDLGKAPLLRLRLIRTGATTYRITRSYHLILMDAWCFSLLMVDFFRFYDALVGGQPLTVPKPRPYREYIAWLQQQDMAEAEGFWREQLRGFTTPTPLGVLRDRRAEWSGPDPMADTVVTLSEATTAALQAWATRHRVTLNTVVQGAWAWLLSRYSGETEVLFGVTVAGRPPALAGVEDMVGLFINSLPLRVTVPGDHDVVSWLQGLFAQNLRLRQYEYAPLVQIQSWSEVPRGRALFDSLLVFESAPSDPSLTSQASSFCIEQQGNRTHTNYPLTVVVVPLEALELQLTYDRRQCEEGTIRRMLAQFQGVLEQFVAAPGRRLGEVTVLSPAEVTEQTRTWNETEAAYPADQSVADLFEAQAARTPGAVAVQCGPVAVTYAELDARAEQVAQGLVALGVGPDTVVAVLAARDVEWVTLLLGILKAGGAYLPLDPAHPPARWRQLLTQGPVRQLLTTEAVQNRLGPLADEVPAVTIHTRATLPAGAGPRPRRRTHPQQVGYVLFTSGSTGQPKGAVVTQQGMVNNVWGKLPAVGLTARDVVAQTAGVSFDISVWQALSALLCGGRVEILAEEIVQEPARLVAELARTGVTVAELVPSLLREVVAVESPAAVPALRWLMPTGEAVTPDLCRAWFARYPGIPLLNAYGPAECADDVAYHVLRGAPGAGERSVPIGRPAANLEVYVLTADQQPVPVGVTGELWIGGVGVGRGYLGEPGRTAAAFVPHPYAPTPGARLYRTGDLGRYRPDGTLEFQGRRDQQVKVRGFRIELGEIEAALAAVPGITDQVVVVREARAGQPQLVAYVVWADAAAPPDVRAALRATLPGYMVPGVIVPLAALPLTPNGKVDRKALPAPEDGALPRGTASAPPATPTEALLATIWAELLGVEQVGRHDNFFDLGGHSLLATQAVSRVRKAFQIELPLRALFDGPTIVELAAAIELVRREKDNAEAPPLIRARRSNRVPLSFAQERLWYLDQLEPNSPAYNIATAFRLQGALDVKALQAALQEMIYRHESLRTTIVIVDNRPVQVIGEDAAIVLRPINLTAIPKDEREAAVRRLVSEEAKRPFDLSQGPLIRATALQLASHEHVLLLTMHHIVSDGWSMGLFVKESVALYQAFTNGTQPSLPELPIQYADFALWQRQWLAGSVLDRQLAYWKETLAGIPPLLTLPTARPRPAAQTYRGARIPFKLSASLTQQLHALGQAEGATLFMTLLAAFQILLSRYSGQHDICVGVPIANRTRLEIEGLIGFFVNTLVLRTDVSGNPSCRTFLQRVRERVVAAQAHQDVPFEKVVEAVQPIRSLGHSPLFQVMFTFQNAPLEALEIPGLSIEALTIEDKTAKFDLSMELNETQEGLSGFVEYSTDLFDDDMMARMVEHYRVLLEQIAARPASRLSELSLLTEEERSTITGTWNETEAAYPADQSVADLFEAQAARTPGAVAVQCGPVAVTYAELEARAEQVAQGLVALGVGPDTIVAVLAERDVEWVTFVLGILKAGGAYLPLDPTHPAARRRQMLTQGQVRQLLTTEAARSRVGSLADEVPGLTIHTRASLPGDGSPRPRRRTHSKQAGYVLYTSGSTGLPKGAVVTQQGMVNNVWGKIPTLGLTDRDVVAQTAGVGFDISVWQVLSALLCGGRVAIIADEVVREPARLLAELARTGVTVAELVPSLLREVVAVESPVGVPALRWLLPTGEAVTPDLCRAWFARYPGIPLLNAYGPAECADDVAYHVLKAAPGAEERLVPIGRPAANLDLYVLDADLAAVPVGVTGEICIGGVGVGRGYLGEPERTAAAFVPHPYATTPGARLYRTGDLGRYRLDGTLEFHGRRDQQVKVRGFRIELGEIEAALAAVPGITDQVVVVREARAGQPQLVAYVVWADAAVAGATDLRAALRATLPEYMVPGVIVPLAALPLTPNGKVNRNALPAPEEGDLPRGTAYAPPETPAEELLATIWAELLGVPRVGRHDNFFDLGGDSILSIQVISRCRQSNIMLSPRHVIEHQTIAELAAKAAMERDCDIQAELGPVSGEVPLTPIQQWFFEQEILDPHYYNQAVLLEVRQDLTPAILESAFRHVLQQHDMLRARFRRDGEGWTQWIEPSVAPLAVHRVDLSHVSETDQEQLMVESAEEWHRRLHLSQGPLLQVVLFERGMSRSQRLLIIIHHAVVDWVSWRILVEDLQTACRQVMQGQPIQLPAKTSSYKQWAERLRIYAQSEEPAQDAVYWTDSRWAQAKEIPVDYPEGKRTNELTAAVTVELTAAETQALLQDVPRAYQSQITDVLLTAMVQSIGCWTGHSCLAVDLDRHGREDIFAGLDVSRTVGWFAGLFPVWLEVRPDAFPREAVRIVKEQLRLVPHQGIGYGVLKYLAPGGARSRQLRAMPAAQVCFNYLGQFDQTLPETGLFAAAAESSGRSQDGQDRLDHELSFTAAIIRGRLELSLTYGKERYRRATMETIVGVYVEILQDVIAHTGSRNPKSVLTPLAH